MENQEFFNKIKELVEKLKINIENDKLEYTAQISDSTSQDKVKYCVSIHGFSNSLSPASFVENTPEEVISKVEKFTLSKDKKWADIQYYKAQTYACLESAKHYRNLIQELEDEDKKDGEK